MTTEMILTPDAEPGPETYVAVVRDSTGLMVTNCQHSHKTRTAAERCAERWLIPILRLSRPAEKETA